MKAISILRPWGAAFFLPNQPKDVENRDWKRPVKYRGPILIHTGLGTGEIRELEQCARALPDHPLIKMLRPLMPFKDLVRGVILGRAELVDCLPLADYERRYGPSPWAFGPMCLVIRNARKFERPIPFKGALGLFDVPGEVLAKHGVEGAAPVIRRSRGI